MNKKCSILTFLVLLSIQPSYADINTYIERTKIKVESVKNHTRYYGSYALAGVFVSAGFVKNNRFGLGALGLTGLYGITSAVDGYFKLKQIRQKYTVRTQPLNPWDSQVDMSEPEIFSFARWRQQDDRYDDGYYWPTAWLMREEISLVRRYFLHDIHTQRVHIIVHGAINKQPRPDQVLNAIDREIAELEQDKRAVKRYTTIYLEFDQAEAAKPDISYWRLFWPNYNTASKLYIEIVTMLKRLELLRCMVATLKAEVIGGGWPRA